jgi:hypothetical protein
MTSVEAGKRVLMLQLPIRKNLMCSLIDEHTKHSHITELETDPMIHPPQI